jgi:hypothetical protein
LILGYFKKTELNEIVEIGSGYGGLFLAIDYFSKILKIEIKKYNLIDLPIACELINYYLNKHNTSIPFQTHNSTTYGNNIDSENLFLISNYCFSEISNFNKENYCKILLPKTKNGFLTWTEDFISLDQVNILNKDIKIIENERPSTGGNKFIYY